MKPEDAAKTFEDAATAWDELGLPKFEVQGYFDGKVRFWDGVAELLRFTAERCKEVPKDPERCPSCDGKGGGLVTSIGNFCQWCGKAGPNTP